MQAYVDAAAASNVAVDTTAPALTLPADIAREGTGPNGAVVNFAATASDNWDPNPTVTCTPPSGSTFPIGPTTVHCTAADATGNTAEGTFTVTILGASEQLSLLADALADIGGGSFSTQLTAANQHLALGQEQAACNTITAFANHVQAQTGKQLTETQANELLTAATRIKAVIDC